jgi:hypothetical protein
MYLKIDAVLSRMESMEKLKIKRREAMVKILDSVTNVSESIDIKEWRGRTLIVVCSYRVQLSQMMSNGTNWNSS